jgi:hypothetical protein
MSRDDKQKWAEAYNKEYQGFKGRNAIKVVRPEKGIRIHDALTRLEYKEDKTMGFETLAFNLLISSCTQTYFPLEECTPTFVPPLYRLQKQDCWQQ